MKILLASSSFRGGGITSYALELTNSYSVNHEFYLMVGETNGYINEKTFSNLIHADMDNLSAINANFVTNIINELNPDVLIISNACVVGLIIPFLNDSIRIITVSHSLRYNEADIAAFHAPFIDKIIALSHYNMEYLQNKFRIGDEGKIHVIYNFFKSSTDGPSVSEKKEYTHKPIIVFAGGSAPSKSPELVHSILLKLLKTPAEFRFYWLGVTYPPLKKIQFLKKIEQIVPDDHRVIFTGKIPRKEATSILSKANIILMPSRREGCPMALLEAMSAGIIALTSDYKNGCREIVENAKCGKVISHENSNQFVNTILDIINDPTHYDHNYDAAISFFNKKLSFPAWKNEMDRLIQDTNRRHSPRKPFSESEYANILARWKKYSHFNAIHMLLFETFPSALVFFYRNIFYKHYEHHKKNKSNIPL